MRCLPSLVLACALLLPVWSSAAELTSTPPMLRGDVELLYRGGINFVRLEDRADTEDAFVDVGAYSQVRQGMNIGAAFSPYHGIAIRLDLPLVFHDARVWEFANGFRYDPEAGRPVAVGGSPLSPDMLNESASSRVHRGPGDLALGFRVVPVAEEGVPGREGPASLAFDFDLRVPSGSNHDQVRDDGSAGPGWGGVQVRVALSGSRRFGPTEPFLSIHYTHRAAYKQDLTGAQVQPADDLDPEGRSQLDPADDFGFRFGSELIMIDDREADRSMRLQVGFGLTYRGPHELSSGTILPAPLDETVGHRARSSEHLMIDLLFGLRARVKPQAELRVDFAGGWASPHSVEQVDSRAYGVRTGPATFHVSWGVGALIRIR
ncbi:MAG: hypothetical protein VX498_02030 [Myxococcota bacterium]|nr:hypothetical protein [Myxococcota bacterium]